MMNGADEPGIAPANDELGNDAYYRMRDALAAVTAAEKGGG